MADESIDYSSLGKAIVEAFGKFLGDPNKLLGKSARVSTQSGFDSKKAKDALDEYHSTMKHLAEQQKEAAKSVKEMTEQIKRGEKIDKEAYDRKKEFAEHELTAADAISVYTQKLKLAEKDADSYSDLRKIQAKREASVNDMILALKKSGASSEELFNAKIQANAEKRANIEEASRKLIEESATADKKTRKAARKQQEILGKEKEVLDKRDVVERKKKAADKARAAGLEAKADQLEAEAKVEEAEADKLEKKAERASVFEELASEDKIGHRTGSDKINKWKNALNGDENPGALGDALADALSAGAKEVNENIKDIVKHRTKTMARLQGFGGDEFDYDGLLKTMKSNIGMSPYVTQSEYLSNLDKAVQEGVAYNIEQRTFLATISDEISDTFEVFNSELLRLIKLQQADSTAARMGMEAAIQKSLNGMFSDSSYTKDMYQSVSGSLLGAESLMTRDDAVEFEYQVQKWLGALYSLGFSSNAITDIASAINAIGTGDVTALSGTSGQTLMAMAAQRAGVDYADALVNGLDASKTNDLLKAMVEYLQQIAEESGNNVVRSAYKDVYSLSLSDMKAISSLTSTDIESLYSSNMTYSGAQKSLNQQMSSISNRLSLAEMTSNVIENFKYGIAEGIASSPTMYTLWAVTDLINNATGGIHLPHVAVMGNTIDLSSFTVEGLMQGALMGISTLGQIGSLMSAIGNGFALSADMESWNATETTSRGGLIETTGGFTKKTSQSTYVASSSGGDMKNSALSDATSDAQETSEITNASVSTEHTFDDFYNAVFVDMNTIPVSLESIGKNGDDQLAQILGILLSLQNLSDNVFNVNIVSSEKSVPIKISDIGLEMSAKTRGLLLEELSKAIALDIKKEAFGYGKDERGYTVADTMRKISSGDVEVEVKKLLGTSNPRGFAREMSIF